MINPITGLPNIQTIAYNPFVPGLNPTGELLDYPVANSSKADAITWKVGAEFDAGQESMLFATASRGFKGGGTYVDLPGVDSSFKPEFLTAFELGSRNRFFDNKLQVNAELFYWKLTDQQVPYVGFNSIAQVTFLTANAGRAKMYGADVDIIWRATPNDTLRGSVEYLHSKYDAFSRSIPSAVVLPTTQCSVTGYAGPTSLAPAVVDCAGQPLLRSPRWSGSAGYEHVFDLADSGEVRFNADMTFASGRFISPAYTLLHRQGPNQLFNASLAYETASKSLLVTAWIRNIGNSRVFAGGEQFVTTYSRPALMPPRTYGVTTRLSF